MDDLLPTRLPIIVTMIAAAALGLFWLPLRALAQSGLDASLATIAVFLMPVLVLVSLAGLRLVRGKAIGMAQGITGLLTGGALALYSESLLHTDVARTLILFYVTPVWSTLLEVVLLKQRLSKARAIALILGLAGLVTILGGRTGVPLPQNLGDSMALLAGMVWAFGSFRVRLATDFGVFENLFSFFFFGSLVAVLIAILPITPGITAPKWNVLMPLLPWLILVAVGFMIPIFWGILWGSQHIDSGRLGILLQIEAVVGIASAALLTEELFGFVKLLGALLVIGAAVVDVLGSQDSIHRDNTAENNF
jgi:drug/metabolite transporter (DMT)-like permease